MTVFDGFFFGIGLCGALLVLIVFFVVVTLIAAFISYLLEKGKRSNPGRRDDDGDHRTL